MLWLYIGKPITWHSVELKYDDLSVGTIVQFQKISIPPHGRDLSYDPPSPLDFPKAAHKVDPPPLPKFHFCRVSPENIIIPLETKNKLCLAQNTEF